MMYPTAYQTRCDTLIDFFADREAGGYLPYTEFVEVAARLYRDRPLEQIKPDLDRLLADPHGDMFWMIPMVLMVYLGRSRLPEADLLDAQTIHCRRQDAGVGEGPGFV